LELEFNPNYLEGDLAMPIQKKSINQAPKNVKKAKAGATRLSGKYMTATKQVEMKSVDVSSPKLYTNCAKGSH
jgi:hypothetical protein